MTNLAIPAKSEEELNKALDHLIDWILGHDEEELRNIDFRKAKNEVWYAVQAHTATVAAEAAREAVIHIMSAKTEGLFDGPDLFIKRAPIEQACIDLVGYEAYRAIADSLPVATLTTTHSEEGDSKC